MAWQAVRELRGRAAKAIEEEIPFDEAAEVIYWTERDRMALAYYYKYRILKQFMARDLEGCVASADRAAPENGRWRPPGGHAHHPPQSASAAHLVEACSRELSE